MPVKKKLIRFWLADSFFDIEDFTFCVVAFAREGKTRRAIFELSIYKDWTMVGGPVKLRLGIFFTYGEWYLTKGSNPRPKPS